MRIISRAFVPFLFVMALGAGQFLVSESQAQSTYFTNRGCTGCHAAPVAATCAGCHQHSGTLSATKNKTTSYTPGETVTITLTASGARAGWLGVRLYDQTGAEIARSTGSQSGMGGSATYPAVLSAPAPATAGTYTWRIAYFGNENGTGSGDVHSEKSVNVSITVAAAGDTTAPTVDTFTLPATAASLTVPVSALTASDNVAVIGYLINKSATPPAASAAGWATTAPASVSGVAGSNTYYAWARDAAGNVSLAKSANVIIAIASADTTKPALTVSALADGVYTNKTTLNISGNASDAGGLQSVTVNGEAVAVNPDGSFSAALPLVTGANTVTVIASDKAGNQQADIRTITYDSNSPVLTVSAPADNSNSAQSFTTLTGTVSEASTVTVTDNSGNSQSAAMNGNNFTVTVNLAPGINTIGISASDLAGNITSAKRTVTYDSGKMTLAVTYPNQDITTGKSRLVLKGTVVDATSKVTVRITMDGRTFTPKVANGAFKQTLTFKKAKQYSITIAANDAAGNSSSVSRNVIYRPAEKGDDDEDTGSGTTSHPFGWTDPKSSHDNYVENNGVGSCISCHSIDQASKGQAMSCYNCHGKEWDTPSTGGSSTGGGTSHPFGWTDPKSSHDNYVENNGVGSCVSCHSIDQASKGQAMSCYNCHGKQW